MPRISLKKLSLKRKCKEVVNIYLLKLPSLYDNKLELVNKDGNLKLIEKTFQHLANKLEIKGAEANLIVLPELSVPLEKKDYLKEFSKEYNTYIVAGLEYDDNVNKSIIFIPGESPVEQHKHKLSPIEKDKKNKVEIKHSKLDDESIYFINSEIGNFLVMICIDLAAFEDYDIDKSFSPDFLIIIANNKEGKYFKERLSGSPGYKLYTHSVLCNVKQYEGTGIMAPVIPDGEIASIDEEEEYIVCYKIYLNDFFLAKTNYPEYKRKCTQENKKPFYMGPQDYTMKQGFLLNKIITFYEEWSNERDKVISLCKDLAKQFKDDRIDAFNVMLNNIKKGFEKQEYEFFYSLRVLTEIMESIGAQFEDWSKLIADRTLYLAGGIKFNDIEEFKKMLEFVNLEYFLGMVGLKMDDYKKYIEPEMEKIAQYCKRSCEKYPSVISGYNVISKRFESKGKEFMLITRSGIDKSKIEPKDIILVHKSKDLSGAEKYYYTNKDGEEDSQPSQETHLNYSLHTEIDIKDKGEYILHFHSIPVLNYAWAQAEIMQFDEGRKLDLFNFNKKPVYGLLAREIGIFSFAKDVAKVVKENDINMVIGIKHGAWMLGNSLEDMLESMNEFNEWFEESDEYKKCLRNALEKKDNFFEEYNIQLSKIKTILESIT
jgi:ribulose-5-phosphate 4-epimerase/fuculose-1-phosphate aldolase